MRAQTIAALETSLLALTMMKTFSERLSFLLYCGLDFLRFKEKVFFLPQLTRYLWAERGINFANSIDKNFVLIERKRQEGKEVNRLMYVLLRIKTSYLYGKTKVAQDIIIIITRAVGIYWLFINKHNLQHKRCKVSDIEISTAIFMKPV